MNLLKHDFLLPVQQPDLVLHALTIRDIADGSRDQSPFVRFERAKTDLHGELPTVLVQPEEFQTGTHRSDPRFREKLCPVSRVIIPEALRDEDINALAQ